MARGKKTGGRKPGSRNKRNLALEAQAKAAAERIKEALGDSTFEGDAHALLMSIYKDQTLPMDLRADAAKAAIRFEKPALSSVDGKGNLVPNYIAYLPRISTTPEEWMAETAHLRAENQKHDAKN